MKKILPFPFLIALSFLVVTVLVADDSSGELGPSLDFRLGTKMSELLVDRDYPVTQDYVEENLAEGKEAILEVLRVSKENYDTANNGEVNTTDVRYVRDVFVLTSILFGEDKEVSEAVVNLLEKDQTLEIYKFAKRSLFASLAGSGSLKESSLLHTLLDQDFLSPKDVEYIRLGLEARNESKVQTEEYIELSSAVMAKILDWEALFEERANLLQEQKEAKAIKESGNKRLEKIPSYENQENQLQSTDEQIGSSVTTTTSKTALAKWTNIIIGTLILIVLVLLVMFYINKRE